MKKKPSQSEWPPEEVERPAAPGPGPPRRIWFQRQFEFGIPLDAFPGILERVRGTPARLEERVMGLSRRALRHRYGQSWTIQENVGHLLDLEPLWAGRLDELLDREPTLRPADLENRATHEANHHGTPVEELLAAFRRARSATVARLERLAPDDLRRTALHPRLQQPMTVVDLFFFVAEHDDHHLARISELVRLAH